MKQRYCIHCGKLTAQKADNLFVCPDAHENWIDYVPGASCFVMKDGKVLFGVRSIEPHAGGLAIPGGFLNLGETLEEAVAREAKEELGIEVRLVHFLGSYLSEYSNRSILNLTYVAEMVGGEVRPADDMNGGEPVWRDIDNLPTEAELAWQWEYEAQADLVKWHDERNDDL